jgi:hypothetical protein
MCAGVIDAIWAAVVLQPLAQPGSRLTAAVRITIVDRRLRRGRRRWPR